MACAHRGRLSTIERRNTNTAQPQRRNREVGGIEDRDDDDGHQVVDNRKRQQEDFQRSGYLASQQGAHTEREGDIGRRRHAQPRNASALLQFTAAKIAAGVTNAAERGDDGQCRLFRARQRPSIASRLISSPTSRKKTAISPSLIQCSDSS